ncbi:MAG: BadF/BadG/BcrA/BcrD ATPase family protein [Geminicoccaceae bacterium]
MNPSFVGRGRGMLNETVPAGSVVVGVDIGGTKTHLRAVGNGILRDRVLITSEWRRRQWMDDAQSLLGLGHGLADGTPIAAIGVGAHGCDSTEECASFRAAFGALTSIPVSIVNDAELMPLSLGFEREIGVVAGTGSIAVYRDVRDELQVAGGWGWIIGDDGSAAGLVREAFRVVALHLDRGGSRDEPLVWNLFRSLRLRSPERLGSVLATFRDAAAVGSHAPAIFEAAEAGSQLALDVINGGGLALADLVSRLCRRGVNANRVVAGGGVITTQPLLWKTFSSSVRTRFSGMIEPLLYTDYPVEGACRLAASLAPRTVTTAEPIRTSR